MSQLRWEYRVSLFFMACCLVLIMVMFGEWVAIENYREEIWRRLDKVESTGYEVEKIPAFKFLQHPIEYYADLVNRPLFNEGRKPIEEITDEKDVKLEEKVAPPKEDFKLQLIGNIDTPNGGAVALFENLQAKELKDRFKRFKKGDEYNGWKIIEVSKDMVVINDGINQEKLLLRKLKPRPRPKVDSKRKRALKRRRSSQKETASKKKNNSPANKAFKPLPSKLIDAKVKEPGVQFRK